MDFLLQLIKDIKESIINFIRNSPGIIAGISLPIKFQEWQFPDHGHSAAFGNNS